MHLHPIHDRKHLQRWGTHSLRVGACVVLHAMGFSALDIQWILRWRSMAFLTYLRNLTVLATKQVRALDRAAAILLYEANVEAADVLLQSVFE